MVSLGLCHDYGMGTAVDKQKGFRLYKKASDAGHIGALHNVALCCADGEHGAVHNMKFAISSLQQAAEAGSSDSLYVLGTYYQDMYAMDEDTVNILHVPDVDPDERAFFLCSYFFWCVFVVAF